MPQNFSSMASMMVTPGATAPIPTVTYNSANLIGTPVPMVGDNSGRPAYAGAVGGTSATQIVLVAIGLFALGYVLFHINFEK